MKKILLALASVILTTTLSAKKVKFAVDMTGVATSSLGIHVIGDFQEAAGFALNWDPTLTTLTQEGTTNIYSVIVTIPAFQKYEYRFVNGDQTYEAEFVPLESRVDDVDDNRWLYVDSLSNDTTFVGAIQFGMNAPAGLNLIRYKVDMTSVATSSANGVHVATSYNSFSPLKTRLYSFANNVYEIINYKATGNYSYKFVNGKTTTDIETVVGGCTTSGNRTIALAKDSVLPIVCYNYCTNCGEVSINELRDETNQFNVFPNPASSIITLQSKNNELMESITIVDVTGKQVLIENNLNVFSKTISLYSLSSGMYSITIVNKNNQAQRIKFVVE